MARAGRARPGHDPAARRLGRRPRGDELLLLRGDRAAAARHGAAAIEFLPVVVLAAVGVRTPRNGLALALAVAGVYELSHVELTAQPLGFAFAFANAALFATYIVLAHRVARHPAVTGIDGLGVAMLIAAVLVTPVAAPHAAQAFTDPVALAAGIGVGICSSVIPYVTDQLAMANLSRAAYSLMVALSRRRNGDRRHRASQLPTAASLRGSRWWPVVSLCTEIWTRTQALYKLFRQGSGRADPPKWRESA